MILFDVVAINIYIALRDKPVVVGLLENVNSTETIVKM